MLKKFTRTDDIVIFIQNGVYVAKQNIELVCQKYVVKSDALARGIADAKDMIEYDRVIELVYKCEKVVTVS